MRLHKKVAEFTDKYPLLGPLVWVLSIQYFMVQIVAAHAWPKGYSWRHNLISDLGNTACGQYTGRYVCSPDHALMNLSFVLLGITMAVGSLLVYQEFKRGQASLVAFTLMALSGFGTMLVGLFPENTFMPLHAVGAFFALVVGNVSLVMLAFTLQHVRPSLRLYTCVSGVFSLVCFTLFSFHISLGLGQGGMERLVSYPQTLWLVLFGLYMTRTHLVRRSKQQL